MAAVSSILAGAALAVAVGGTAATIHGQKQQAKAQKKAAKQRAQEIQALTQEQSAGPAAAAPVNTNTGSVFRLGADASSSASGRRSSRQGRGAVAPFLGGLGGSSGLRIR